MLQAIFGGGNTSFTTVTKPKPTDTSKVVSAVVRSPGCIANVRLLTKNIKNMATEVVKGKI